MAYPNGPVPGGLPTEFRMSAGFGRMVAPFGEVDTRMANPRSLGLIGWGNG